MQEERRHFSPAKSACVRREHVAIFVLHFFNDLEHYFIEHGIPGIKCEFVDDGIVTFFKIFTLLYADDTVIFSESPDQLQNMLNVFNDYCKEWKLTVNVSETKVLIISRGRPSTKIHFYLDRTKLKIVHENKYLGIYLSRSGSFSTAKKYTAEQANKTLFSLLRKIRSLELSFDLQIHLVNKTVKPVLLYCSEIWGMGNCDIIERIQLKFLKRIFNLKRSTPTFMIYGELGITPISVGIKKRAISFWSKIVSGHDQPT